MHLALIRSQYLGVLAEISIFSRPGHEISVPQNVSTESSQHQRKPRMTSLKKCELIHPV